VNYFERTNRLGCLFRAVQERGYAIDTPPDTPPCAPYGKLEIAADTEASRFKPEQLKSLLSWHFQVDQRQIVTVAAARDGSKQRLLVGLPQRTLDEQRGFPIRLPDGSGHRHIEIKRYDQLWNRSIQRKWERFARQHPPRHRGGGYRTAQWNAFAKVDSRLFLAPIAVLFLVLAGAWLYNQVLPRLQVASHTVQTGVSGIARQVGLWFKFLGSLLRSIVRLSVANVVTLCVFGLIAYLSVALMCFAEPYLFRDRTRRLPRARTLACEIAQTQDRLAGTVLSVASGLGALLLVALVYGPPDAWTFGIQAVILTIVELVVLDQLLADHKARLLSRLSLWAVQNP
jgi:hypothetical protein